MDDRTVSPLTARMVGTDESCPASFSWDRSTYAINVFQVRTVHEDHAVTGSELTVRRLNHTSTTACDVDQ
jgi:hypothetical protein